MVNSERNIKISGSGVVAGGEYDEVRISGSGAVNGDVICNVFSISGSAKVDGNLKAEELKTSGGSKINGNVEGANIRVSGSVKVDGDIAGKNIKISGSLESTGNMKSEEIKVSGSLKVGNECEAEKFASSGGIKINELLNAGDINISLGGTCVVKEIGGEHIEIKKSSSNNSFIGRVMFGIFTSSHRMQCENIEGDEIYLENTTCKVVRGRSITIGSGCEIERVEYSGRYEMIEESKVREAVKI